MYGPVRTVVSQGQRVTAYLCQLSLHSNSLIGDLDNGIGIADFAKLLCLGDSGWDPEVQIREDSAGIGCFSLSHSGVEVISRNQRAVITKEAFRGLAPVEVTEQPSTEGTLLVFTRSEIPEVVERAIREVTKYGATDVVLNGEKLERSDFLATAQYVKTFRGVRIGVFENYERGGSYWQHKTHFNFFGKVIHGPDLPALHAVLPPNDLNKSAEHDIHVDVDVLEASCVHLKLPDRSDVVQDENFKLIAKEARRAMFEYLATRPHHIASYELYKEAKAMGIELAEAQPRFKEFSVDAASSEYYDNFFPDRKTVTADPAEFCQKYAIVSEPSEEQDALFTFEVGRTFYANAPLIPVQDEPKFRGYSWYSQIPRFNHFEVTVTGLDKEQESRIIQLVDGIELSFNLVRREDGKKASEKITWSLPFAAHYGEWDEDFSLTVTRDSAWTKGESGEFDLVDAAFFVGFHYSDEGDTYDTQEEYFRGWARRDLTAALYGPLGAARHAISTALDEYSLRKALENANVKEVHLVRENDKWTFTLATAEAAA